ncbi:hypothetical protein R3P38DRAFT_2880920, partial [Favolaschia claudopus]
MPRVTSLVFSLFLATFIAAAPVVPVELTSHSLYGVTAEVAAVSEINVAGAAVPEIYSPANLVHRENSSPQLSSSASL